MRRLTGLFAAFLLILLLTVPAGAVTEASSVKSYATVNTDGSCQISLTVTLHLEEPVEELYFPVPKAAAAVTLNGARVSALQDGSIRRINLSKLVRNVVGDVTVNVQFNLRDVIVPGEEDTLQLQVPLLSGFAHPIKAMEFSVTLPGAVENLPGFNSGYHQNRIEESLQYEVNGPTVSGCAIRTLNDHETLTMTMVVSETMFPRTIIQSVDYYWATVAMILCGCAALLYWIISMFNRPGFARTQTEPPQGYHAGNLGSALAGRGFDLTMAVLEWAQLGYILIHVKGKKVLLYKQMEMGNERSAAELRWFKKLFAKKNVVNTAEYRYAALYRLAAKKPDRLSERMKKWNGNPLVFRALTAGVGLFAGVSLAVAMADGAALQGVLMVLLGILGAVGSWYMQEIGYGILLRDKRMLSHSLLNFGIWLLLSLLAGDVGTGLLLLGEVFVLGLLLSWGGRRTPLGRLVQMQTLGFARYLRIADKKNLQRLCKSDPMYFFRLVPGALALGREKTFAKKFGDLRLESCPYLTSGMDGHMTALQWSVFMRKTVEKMNDRANGMWLEKLLQILATIKKG